MCIASCRLQSVEKWRITEINSGKYFGIRLASNDRCSGSRNSSEDVSVMTIKINVPTIIQHLFCILKFIYLFHCIRDKNWINICKIHIQYLPTFTDISPNDLQVSRKATIFTHFPVWRFTTIIRNLRLLRAFFENDEKILVSRTCYWGGPLLHAFVSSRRQFAFRNC